MQLNYLKLIIIIVIIILNIKAIASKLFLKMHNVSTAFLASFSTAKLKYYCVEKMSYLVAIVSFLKASIFKFCNFK